MRKALILATLAAVTLTACGGWRDSRMNPWNWFAPSEAAEPVLITEAKDPRMLVQQITELKIEPTTDGVIVRATGLPPDQGWWDAELVEVDTDEDGLQLYEFRVVPPRQQNPAGTEFSRRIVAGAFISNHKLADITRVQVQGANNALSAGR